MKGKVLLAKPGLDGHESGVMLVARALRDAGFEVVYLGLRQTAAAIAAAAVAEDANAVGLSVLTGAHITQAEQVLGALRSAGAGDIPVVMGGIISPESAVELLDAGVAAVFGPGGSLGAIVAKFESLCCSHSA
jgi:methylmalonyl-CoA mutase C-terminal domain/subunit